MMKLYIIIKHDSNEWHARFSEMYHNVLALGCGIGSIAISMYNLALGFFVFGFDIDLCKILHANNIGVF